MCSHQVLSHNESGYVIKYSNCAAYQVAFGTTIASFSASDYSKFVNEINEFKIITVPNGFPRQKRIHLKIGSCKAYMILNYEELNLLHTLIEQAIVEEEVRKMLDNNNLISSN